MVAYFPIYLNIEGKKCVVVGGGAVALRKVKSLLACGAQVTVVSPELATGLEKLASKGSIAHLMGEFAPEHMDGASLVIAATNDLGVNSRVASEANRRGVPVNVVDAPTLCDFVVPSLVRRGDLIISISTCGKSPALAKKIRIRIEREFGKEYGPFLKLMEKIRKKAQREIKSQKQRSFLFDRLVNSDIIDMLNSGRNDMVKVRVSEMFDDAKRRTGDAPGPGRSFSEGEKAP